MGRIKKRIQIYGGHPYITSSQRWEGVTSLMTTDDKGEGVV